MLAGLVAANGPITPYDASRCLDIFFQNNNKKKHVFVYIMQI